MGRSLRVLMVGPDVLLTPGGMAEVSRLVISGFESSNSGVTVRYVSSHAEGGLVRKCRALLSGIIELARCSGHVDVAHLQVASGLSVERKLLIALWCRLLGLPVVVHLHGADSIEDYTHGSVMHRFAYKKLMGSVFAVMPLGTVQESWLREAFPLALVKTVPNFSATCDVDGLMSAEPRLAFVGRIGHRKGADLFVAAVKSLLEEGRAVTAVMLGDGEVEKYRSYIGSDHKLRGRVEVVGWADKKTLMKEVLRSWAVVLPSRGEGLPMALIEAMGAARAVVATDVGSVRDLVLHRKNGFLCDVDDLNSLREGLKFVTLGRQHAIDLGAFSKLFEGISELDVIDFPDHPNVGDSAIFLGQMAYFARAGIAVQSAHCIGTLPKSLRFKSSVIVINGGGNIAGQYPKIDIHRNYVARNLAADSLLIQAPQSIHFADSDARNDFISEFTSRGNMRFAARDERAELEFNSLSRHRAVLSPDAVHLIGQIDCPPPTQPVVILARVDEEAGGTGSSLSSVDWPKDRVGLSMASRVRWHANKLGAIGEALNPSVRTWTRIAQRRFSRGVDLLSPGETVVTDRLHAMLIALQMGRRVVAVDNSNQKLTKYADSWFGSVQPAVRFANSLEEALKIAGK